MNGTDPKIEIFTPFGAGYEWMKQVLFRPFDFGKWLIIAFAAFISGSWGGGPNFNFRWGGGDWKYKWSSHGNAPDWSLPAWGIALIVVVALFVLLLIVVLTWVSSRGRFIFTDCVVKNRAAIAEPWREYRREGNSFFLFLLAVGFLSLLLAGLVILILAVALGLFSDNKAATAGFGATAIVSLIIFGLIWLLAAIFIALVSEFMVPVMYRRRCLAKEAFLDVTRLVFRHPGVFVLFVLFGIVLGIAVIVVGIVIACMTCCIGGLPYVSTVLLLPAIVWLLAFKLFFLRQFGDQYDVWATAGFPEPPASPPPPASGPVAPAGSPIAPASDPGAPASDPPAPPLPPPVGA